MDIELYYMEKGEGIPLLLLHGNGGDGNYFEHQIEYFSRKYRVIAVDTRGHGRSPRGVSPFTMDQFVEDLKNILDKLRIEKLILLGFSDGANIAMKFALKYEHMLSALILNGGNLDSSGVDYDTQRSIIKVYNDSLIYAEISEEAKRLSEMMSIMIFEPNIRADDLKRLNTPTLVISGTEDLIKEEHTRFIAKSIKNSTLRFIKGDHLIAAFEHEVFNTAVEDYLTKLGL